VERNDDRYKISAWSAEQVGVEAKLQAQGDFHSNDVVGRAMIQKVMSVMEGNVCKDGHRYHILNDGDSRLYCRRCGSVINADG
jgi:hypothetical protein